MEPSEQAFPPARRLMSWRWARLSLAVLIVLALLWSAAWFYVPPLVESQAKKAVMQKLGRRLSLGRVAFNPWTLELTIDDLALAGAAGGAPPLLQVKRIHANAAIMSLFHLAPVIDNLDVDAPMLRLTRLADGSYDIDDLLRRTTASPPSAQLARFAVHNIVVRAGAVDFVDMPTQATRRIRDLELGIPFLSTLPSEREINVEPHLAFSLDGNHFDSAAATAPWSEQGKGEARVHLDHFDIAPYLVYLPKSMPARPQSALVTADLLLDFERHPKLSLRVSGTIEVGGIKVVDAASQELLEAGGIKIAVAELRPLEYVAHLSRVEVDGPHVLAERSANGRVNLMLAAKESDEGPKAVMRVPLPTTAASDAASAPSASQPARPAAPTSPWKVTLAALAIHAGELDWRDVTTTPNAALALTEFSFDAQSISWPVDAPVVFKGEGVIGTQTEHGKMTFSGQGNGAGATLQVGLDALPLAAAGPYARAQLELPFAGTLSADLGIEWKPTPAGPQLKVDARRVALSGLVLGEAKAPEFGLEQIELLDAHVDTGARSASIGQVALHAPRLLLIRDKEGSWNFMHWHRTAAPSPEAAAHPLLASAAPVAAGSVAGGWKLALGDLAIDKARVTFADRSLDELVALNLSDFALQVHGWALDAAGAVPFRVSGRLAVPAGASGKAIGSGVVGSIEVRGEARGFSAGMPKSAKARLLLKDLPLHLVDPYLHAFVDIDVQKAQTSFKGDVAFEHRGNESGPRLRLRGDASIDDFIAASAPLEAPAADRAAAAANEALAARQLLNWKLLSLRGIDVALVPGAPAHVAVAETSLTDFFARIVLDERGRLNLQDVARAPATAQGAASAASAASAAPAVVAAASAPPSSSPGLAPLFEFGPIVLVNGRVNYTDHFVTPNYSADLSELNGRLGAFTSRSLLPGAAPQLADIELRGRAQETGVLEITGKVNPLAKPLALDLKAKVRDLELSPLSPYAIKYSGYGIERGKLSVDLAYLVKPDGELAASNRIVLNQLTFGEKVPGSKGSLPVKLAVALLADSHGVIDVDLPVGGSINDPQFSLGGVIWKAITNLIVKVVTAPFRLLASAFGGGSGDALSTVAFSPGGATLDAEAKMRLDQVAKALLERPTLGLTVSGESRLDVEKEPWKRDRLEQLVRAEKRRRAVGGGASPSAEVTVSEAEYPDLLKEVYKRADIVKPKNAIGLTKDLSTAEMEALLLTSIEVPADAMEQLALRRGVVVRDYLATKDLPSSRLFLAAAKTNPEGADWTPRADLKVSVD
jgi:uncharacterized protein involved in outer membrane biogenesis